MSVRDTAAGKMALAKFVVAIRDPALDAKEDHWELFKMAVAVALAEVQEDLEGLEDQRLN